MIAHIFLNKRLRYLSIIFFFFVIFLSYGIQYVFATTIFTDTFTDSNNLQLITHNNAWSVINANDNIVGNATIQNDELQAGTNSENDDIQLNGISAVDSCISTDILFPGTGTGYHELFLRRSGSQTGTFSNYFSFIDFNNHGIGIGWSINGPGDNQGGGIPDSIWPSTGWHTYKFCVIGNQLTAYLDGNIINSRTDTNNHIPNAGNAAFRVSGQTGPSVDNFVYESFDPQPSVSPRPSNLFSAASHYANPSTAIPSTSGEVMFWLSYKYHDGMPKGDKDFAMDFDPANIHFKATHAQSLVFSNNLAILQGSGSLNGVSGYKFYVIGVDGGGIRIKITDSSDAVVYDTQPGAIISSIPTTSVSGHVIVH